MAVTKRGEGDEKETETLNNVSPSREALRNPGPSGRPKFWKSPESLQIVLPAEDKGSNCEAVAGKGDRAFDIQMTVDKASGSCFYIREQYIL